MCGLIILFEIYLIQGFINSSMNIFIVQSSYVNPTLCQY